MTEKIMAWIRFAIKLEEKGIASYSLCLDKTRNQNAKGLFDFLVKEETRHKKVLDIVLKGYEKDYKEKIKKGVEEFANIKSKIPMFKKSEVEKTAGLKIHEMFNKAIQFEEEGMEFYSDLANGEKEDILRLLLNKLANDEKGHKDAIVRAGKSLF